jgi:hypothetical protein
VFVIGYGILLEVADDAINNVAFSSVASKTQSVPCGLPSTDAIHLLQAFGRYEGGVFMPQLIEPNYKTWVSQVKGAVCGGDVGWTSVGNDGNACSGDLTNSAECREDKARELRAIAFLSNDWSISPTTPLSVCTDATDVTSCPELTTALDYLEELTSGLRSTITENTLTIPTVCAKPTVT